MKKILAILLSLLTLLSCGLLSACSAEKTQPDTPDTETVWETVSEAYIYAFPLVLTDATKTLSTNTDGPCAHQSVQPCKKAGGRLFPHRRDAERRYRLFAGMA